MLARKGHVMRSNVERKLHRLLVEKPLTWPVTAQYKIPPYTLDFFCRELSLAVEVDGDWHLLPGAPEKDARRDAFLTDMGIAVFRISADLEVEVMREKIAEVMEQTGLMTKVQRIEFVSALKKAVHTYGEIEKKTLSATIPVVSGPTYDRRFLGNEFCADCGGSGWKQVKVFSKVMQREESRAARCKCEHLMTPTPVYIWDFVCRKQPQGVLFDPAESLRRKDVG
jgi:very-short-patch-repair endonuclease